jgi:hypothetical protein
MMLKMVGVVILLLLTTSYSSSSVLLSFLLLVPHFCSFLFVVIVVWCININRRIIFIFLDYYLFIIVHYLTTFIMALPRY